MSKFKEFCEKNPGLTEFIRYVIIGVCTTVINWTVTVCFIELTGLDETKIGNAVIGIIAWIISTVFFAFWTYKIFVFRSRSMKKDILWGEFAGFTGARLFTLVVEFVILLIFCDILGFDQIIHFGFTRMVDGVSAGTFGFNIRENYIVKLCACVVVTILNYIFSKLVIFKKGQKLTLDAEKDEGEK